MVATQIRVVQFIYLQSFRENEVEYTYSLRENGMNKGSSGETVNETANSDAYALPFEFRQLVTFNTAYVHCTFTKLPALLKQINFRQLNTKRQIIKTMEYK